MERKQDAVPGHSNREGTPSPHSLLVFFLVSRKRTVESNEMARHLSGGSHPADESSHSAKHFHVNPIS